MNHRQKHLSACLIALAALLSTASIQGAWAQTAPDLGTASTFAALGGAGVTCTSPIPALPAITVTGDVGSLLLAPRSQFGDWFSSNREPVLAFGNGSVGRHRSFRRLHDGVQRD